jgi:hypothetical protein
MLLPLFALLGFALCCYGWGRAAHSIFYRERAALPAFTTSLGVVVLSVFGGLLNAAHWASASSLSFLGYGGIVLAVVFFVRAARGGSLRARLPVWPDVVFVAFVLGLGIVLIAALLPTRAFDYVDDFFSYLVRPVRMLSTGTVGGNPFELLGLSDLGVQPFMQGLLNIWLPLTDAYAFDSIFCFLLGLCLVAELGRTRQIPTALVILTIAVYVAVNPQIVNLSSVYSSSALVLLLLGAMTTFAGAWERRQPLAQLVRAAIPVGAIAATLIAIKLTAALFVLPFCAIVFGVLVMEQPRAGIAAAFAVVASAAISVAGWLAIHLDKLQLSAWSSSDRFFSDPQLVIWPSMLEAFRNRPTLYGGNRAVFLIGVAVLAVSLAFALAQFVRKRDLNALITAAAMSGGIINYVGLAATFNNEAALRYAVPFLIALVPYALLDGTAASADGRTTLSALLADRRVFWLAGLQFIFLIAFIAVDRERVDRIFNDHTAVSIPVSPQNRADQARVLSPDYRAYVRGAQARLPAGATVWAWIDAPFDLDYARNRVWNYNMDWAVAPWRLNATTSDELRRSLTGRGVQYVVWQYRSAFNPDVPTMEGYLRTPQWPEYRVILPSAIELTRALGELAQPADVIWKDDSIEVIALTPH